MPKKKKKKLKRHPWDRWFSYESFGLTKGKHFTCRVDTMAQQIRNAASLRGLSVSIRYTSNQSLRIRKV